MTNVIRLGGLYGGVLGSPLGNGMDHRMRLWFDGRRRVDRCENADHAAPAPGCHCGLWGCSSQTDFRTFLREFITDREHRRRYVLGLYDALPAQKWAESSAQDQREAVERSALLQAGVPYDSYAIVGCRVDDPHSEPAGEARTGYRGTAYSEEVQGRAIMRGCSRLEAIRAINAIDTPPGFRRYRALTVTDIWISRRHVEYATDLRRRYRARVHLCPDTGGNWLTPFVDTGRLSGLGDTPRPGSSVYAAACGMA